jgi:hypothetical protein
MRAWRTEATRRDGRSRRFSDTPNEKRQNSREVEEQIANRQHRIKKVFDETPRIVAQQEKK